jgi:hypothetical protein
MVPGGMTDLNAQVHSIGEEGCKILIVDNLVPDARPLVDLAARLGPFPKPDGILYPGLRRYIGERDREAAAYVAFVCRTLSPLLSGAFGIDQFRVDNASFSLATRRPEDSVPYMRIPHYDGVDQKAFAVLHYLSDPSQGGTAFYRHRRTGFECISPDRAAAYQAGALQDFEAYGEPASYIGSSTEAFERIFEVEGVFNRCLIYTGAMLHSGQLAGAANFSPDPRLGRLTGNIFIRVDAANLGPYMAV